MSENMKDTLKVIGMILLITVVSLPIVVGPFLGLTFFESIILAGMWIAALGSFVLFGGILLGLIIVPLIWLLFGGPSYSTLPDTQKAAIQRARLESRGYRINYFRPAPNHDLPTKR